jgi:integrase
VDWDHGEWQIPAHKMKSREDFLERPIDPDLFAYLKARRKPAGRIFGVLDPEKWEAAVVRAGLNWVTPHTARRTFITRCRRRKVPMEVCMFLSDHRSRSVVIESYLDVGVTPGEAKQALADAAVGKLARKEGGA